MEVEGAAELAYYYAAECQAPYGNTIPMNGPYHCYTRYEPVGVAGQIIPWNFPILMFMLKISPALCAGATSVIKPAENTPLGALRIGELLHEAGLPDGVVNVVPGYGAEAGRTLVTHPEVRKVAFTGSTAVGLEIMRTAGVKPVTLELGGKSPIMVLDDADLETAAQTIAFGINLNSGQVCLASSRAIVQEGIHDKLMVRL